MTQVLEMYTVSKIDALKHVNERSSKLTGTVGLSSLPAVVARRWDSAPVPPPLCAHPLSIQSGAVQQVYGPSVPRDRTRYLPQVTHLSEASSRAGPTWTSRVSNQI